MKKTLILFAACGVLAMAACNNGNTKPEGPTQAQIDSIANAKAADATKQQAQKDSIMNAANAETAKAQAQADSLKGAMAQKDKDATKMSAHHKQHSDHNTTTQTPPPPPQTGLKSHADQNQMNNNSNTNSGGLKSHSDQNNTNK